MSTMYIYMNVQIATKYIVLPKSFSFHLLKTVTYNKIKPAKVLQQTQPLYKQKQCYSLNWLYLKGGGLNLY